MRNLARLLSLIMIISLLSCGSFKTGKNVAIDNPLDKSRNNHSLSKARQEVEKSRRALDKCLENTSGDEARCQSQKDTYDADVEEYVSLQTK